MSHKLIRDNIAQKIPELLIKQVKTDEEFLHYLCLKLQEEIEELKISNYEDIYEWADVFEVLYCIARRKNIDFDSIQWARDKKNDTRGSFTRGYILEI